MARMEQQLSRKQKQSCEHEVDSLSARPRLQEGFHILVTTGPGENCPPT